MESIVAEVLKPNHKIQYQNFGQSNLQHIVPPFYFPCYRLKYYHSTPQEGYPKNSKNFSDIIIQNR